MRASLPPLFFPLRTWCAIKKKNQRFHPFANTDFVDFLSRDIYFKFDIYRLKGSIFIVQKEKKKNYFFKKDNYFIKFDAKFYLSCEEKKENIE